MGRVRHGVEDFTEVRSATNVLEFSSPNKFVGERNAIDTFDVVLIQMPNSNEDLLVSVAVEMLSL